MAKRTDFERRKSNSYPTSFDAAEPLAPWLLASGIKDFAEPCQLHGDLVRHLESFGLRCVYAGDIMTGQDALAVGHYGPIGINGYDAGAAIVTNPPYAAPNGAARNSDLLFALLEHFVRIAPTWLLLGTDWASNWQSARFMAACSDIVPIGRVTWIAGTKHKSYENFGWFKFDARWRNGPRFHWRGRQP